MEGLIIRPIRAADVYDLNEMRIMQGVQETISGIFTERLSFAEDYIKGLTPNDHVFMAEMTVGCVPKAVGFACISVTDNPRSRHEGLFGIMVRTDWQGRGIGRILIEKILDISDNWLNLKRIELVTFADNAKAIRFYESCGFKREALLRANMIKNGTFCDSLLMSRIR